MPAMAYISYDYGHFHFSLAFAVPFGKPDGTSKNYPLLPEPQKEPDEEDIYRLAYTVILRRITELISADFPNASWTWEAPDAQREIRKGKDVSILLSKAGGYRRAVVIIRNATAVKVEYCAPDDKTSNSESETGLRENHEDNNTEMPNETHIDYGLYAYEWVESHIFDLNDISCKQGRPVML